MKSDHERMQLMAAAAVDGRLTAVEQDELQAHLAGCPECRAFRAALRRDNAALVDMLAPIAVPAELRATVAEVERTGRRRPRQLRRGRALAMPSPVRLLVTMITVTLTAGAGFWLASRQPPSPGPAAVVSPTPSPTISGPSASPSDRPALPLGGGPVLVYGFNEGKDHTTLSLIDAGGTDYTLLGDVPFQSILQDTRLQWSADHARLLITRFSGMFQVEELDHPTEAGAKLRLVCCLPEGSYREWTLSPDGNFVAGQQTDDLGSTTIAIVIVPADGGVARSLPVPAGANLSDNIAWAPDGSELAIAGCGPCEPQSPREPPVVHHARLLVVPVDGSPNQEILDLPDASVGSPAWSPDGSHIAVHMSRCLARNVGGDCVGLTSVVASVVAPSGAITDLAPISSESGPAAWSPDGNRLAFFDGARLFVVSAAGGTAVEIASEPQVGAGAPMWSPDGRWLLYGTATDERDVWQLWIVPAEGGEARLLGNARAWTW